MTALVQKTLQDLKLCQTVCSKRKGDCTDNTTQIEAIETWIHSFIQLITQLNHFYLFKDHARDQLLQKLLIPFNTTLPFLSVLSAFNEENVWATLTQELQSALNQQTVFQKNLVLYTNRMVKVLAIVSFITCFFMLTPSAFYALFFLAIGAAIFSMTPDRTGTWPSLGVKYFLDPLTTHCLLTPYQEANKALTALKTSNKNRNDFFDSIRGTEILFMQEEKTYTFKNLSN